MIIDVFSDLMVIKSGKLYFKLQIAQKSSWKYCFPSIMKLKYDFYSKSVRPL